VGAKFSRLYLVRFDGEKNVLVSPYYTRR